MPGCAIDVIYLYIHYALCHLCADSNTQLPFPTVTSSASVSSVAKTVSDSLNGNCERQPIFSHWFALELYKAYQSAKMQVENNRSDPVSLEIQDDTYEVQRDALHNAILAIKVAASLNKDTGDHKHTRGLMGSYSLRRTELVYSALYARALDRFIFTCESTGACLHQGPCRKRDASARGNPEAADVYIVPFDSFYPKYPVVLSDVKMHDDDFLVADRESSLYSITGVTVGSDTTWPVLIGVPGTPLRTDLQLHVVVAGSMWKVTIATGNPWDGALLCTLYAAVHHLCKHACLVTRVPLQDPSPFSDMHNYSIKGPRKRVFFNQHANTISKFYDTQLDLFLRPSTMEELIQTVQPLPEMKLTHLYGGDRVFLLTYTYIPGDHMAFTYKKFAGVVRVLAKMHKCGFVHGDIRRENMVFQEDGASYLIDFDFVGKDTADRYPNTYNSTLYERHANAIAGLPMKFMHDRYSLAKILQEKVPVSGFVVEQKDIVTKLLDSSHNLQCIADLLATVDF